MKCSWLVVEYQNIPTTGYRITVPIAGFKTPESYDTWNWHTKDLGLYLYHYTLRHKQELAIQILIQVLYLGTW